VSTTRNVVHLASGVLPLTASTIQVSYQLVIDGADTVIRKPTNVPLFSLSYAGSVTVEGVSIRGSSTTFDDPTLTIGAQSTLRLVNTQLEDAGITLMNGAVELRHTRVTTVRPSFEAIKCDSGTVTASSMTFERTYVSTSNCQVTLRRSRFESGNDRTLFASGGLVLVENNLVVNSNDLADAMRVVSAAPGSTIRFNTFVNTSGIASDGVALACDATVLVTSNIFAYASMHPHGYQDQCHSRFSLYDSIAVPTQTAGEGNKTSDGATIFVNRLASDFHLGSSSAARGGGEPGLPVNEDYEGVLRVSPVDMGAFEAP